jgi:hypothetical protein
MEKDIIEPCCSESKRLQTVNEKQEPCLAGWFVPVNEQERYKWNKEDGDFDGYLMMGKDQIQIHFFEFKELDPKENYGQVYIRTDNIDSFYQSLLDYKVTIHPNGPLETKSWGQKEFSLLDPDNNLLTFGQGI